MTIASCQNVFDLTVLTTDFNAISGAIHLNPVHGGTVQLRPSFHYLDRIDEKQKAASRKVHDEENKEDVQRKQQEQELKAKAIQVQIRNKEDPAAAKQLSHTHLQRQADEETWTKLAYFQETVSFFIP